MPGPPLAHAPFQLGEWIVFPRRHAVEPFECPDGVDIGLGHKVSAKAMAVLLQLVESSGQVVGKEDLIEAVWPGAYTSDEALSTVIYELRRVLGDKASAPRYIETIRKSGYRLLAEPLPRAEAERGALETPVTPWTAAPSPDAGPRAAHEGLPEGDRTLSPSARDSLAPATRRRTSLIAGVGVGALTLLGLAWFGPQWVQSLGPSPNQLFGQRNLHDEVAGSTPIGSLAVLPLAAYLSEDRPLLDTALTDMLIGDIAQVCAVDVAPGIALPRESGSWSLDEALDALGVDAVVEGAVARSGDNLWISLQLVDLRTGRMLWNATYDRQLGDELLVLREVTRDAALRIRDELAQHPVWQELPDPLAGRELTLDFEGSDSPEDHQPTFSQDFPK